MDFDKLIFRCIDKMEAENLTNKDVARLAQISESTVSRVLATRGAAASAHKKQPPRPDRRSGTLKRSGGTYA